jgi:beta-aspartyl-peptidase (threonine type)
MILVHGGAGDVPAASRAAHEGGCLQAVRAGGAVLADGGSSVEAVCAAVEVLEDLPQYNAGVGCALTRDGRVSLDVAIMDGKTMQAGGLACLGAFPHPIRIAQRLLSEKEVLLVGPPAEEWARHHGFSMIPESRLITEAVRKTWREVVENGGSGNFAGGTVGAVCRDAEGNMAAGTSTGGTMGKPAGRVGDSPLVGAGTYADETCAISATGEGESFIRACFAGQVAEALRDGMKPEAALYSQLERVRDRYDGIGGAILLTPEGPPIALRTTETMSWAWWSPEGEGSGI